jgi:hypothetical protein
MSQGSTKLGCPPHALTILDGSLRLLGRIEGRRVGG